MNKKTKIKDELGRLISEAPKIAPSIARYDEDRTYGRVTDEQFNSQAAQRWSLEAASIIKQLEGSGAEVFKGLNTEYMKVKLEAAKYHSQSILVHQTMQLLATALQLLESVQIDVRSQKESNDLAVPEKVTIAWLAKHVPVGLWLAAGGFVVAAFVAGVKASEISLVREVFHLSAGNNASAKP